VNVVTELAAARSPLALLLNHRTTGQAVSLLVEAE
jgi:3-oxoacyl-[acyl-carrier-protein] synthase II